MTIIFSGRYIEILAMNIRAVKVKHLREAWRWQE